MRSTRGGYPVEGSNETGDFLAFTQTQLADKKIEISVLQNLVSFDS